MTIRKITLIVEADAATVEALGDAIERIVCPFEGQAGDHECPIPWFIITGDLNDVEEAAWNGELNR